MKQTPLSEARMACERRRVVLLADRRADARAGMRAALEHHGFEVIAEAKDAAHAVALALAHEPQLCLLEMDLPGGALAALREIRAELPRTSVAMLTTSRAEGDVVRALSAGANGYMLKSAAPDRLAAALRALLRGEVVVPRALTEALVVELRKQEALRELDTRHGFRGRILYVPRFAQHFVRRRRARMTTRVAWQSTRKRMDSYRR